MEGFELKRVQKSGLHGYISPSTAPIHTFEVSIESYKWAGPSYTFKYGGTAIFIKELSGTSGWSIYMPTLCSKNKL